jgi:hypothetical protein
MEVSDELHNLDTLPMGKGHQYPLDRRLDGFYEWKRFLAPARD